MYNTKINLASIKEFVESCHPDTKIYCGCDSEIVYHDRKEYVDYTVAVVVHIGGRYGCRVFGQVDREPNYEKNRSRPRLRLMNEVFRAADIYLKLSQLLLDVEIEVHLDINPDQDYNSSMVLQEAIGYIKGTCNILPVVKPDAVAASGAADKLKKKLSLSV